MAWATARAFCVAALRTGSLNFARFWRSASTVADKTGNGGHAIEFIISRYEALRSFERRSVPS
jgi:hypothetical protein